MKEGITLIAISFRIILKDHQVQTVCSRNQENRRAKLKVDPIRLCQIIDKALIDTVTVNLVYYRGIILQ